MHFSLGRDDRKLLLAAALVLVAASMVAAWIAPPRAVGRGGPSSYSSGPEGALAAYRLLTRMGCLTVRWTRPPQDLPANGSGSVLILAEPQLTPTSEEQFAIRRFAASGGRVVATGVAGAWILGVREPALVPPFGAPSAESFEAEIPGPLTGSAPRIEMDGPVRWPPTPAWQLRSYGDQYGAAVVSYRVGRGEMVWWAGATPLTNSGLAQASNLAFFLNSTHAIARPRVFWDEYFHAARPGFWSYAGATPLPWGLAQIGLILAAAVVTFSRRSGPVRPLVAETRLAPLEFVETLGDLYERKRAARTALEIEYQRFRLRLQRRFGTQILPGSMSTSPRPEAAANESALWKTFEECEGRLRSGKLTEPGALQLVQALDDHAARLGLGGDS
ncbi:MAG: DUF4350 domain-containing protein [Terriglobia bacterium]